MTPKSDIGGFHSLDGTRLISINFGRLCWGGPADVIDISS